MGSKCTTPISFPVQSLINRRLPTTNHLVFYTPTVSFLSPKPGVCRLLPKGVTPGKFHIRSIPWTKKVWLILHHAKEILTEMAEEIEACIAYKHPDHVVASKSQPLVWSE